MTYTIDDATTMVLTDVGDTFTVDPMLIFYIDGKEVPISGVFPGVEAIDISENLLVDGYNVTVNYSNGSSATTTVPSLESVSAYICKLATGPTEAATTVAEPSSDTEPTSETEPATEPAEAHKQLLPSNGTARVVLQDFSRDRVSFWVVYYDCDCPNATQVDLDKTVAHIPYTTDALDPSDINCFLQRCIDATHAGDEWFANGGEAVLAQYVIDKIQAEIAHSLAQGDGEDDVAYKRQIVAKYQARLDELEPPQAASEAPPEPAEPSPDTQPVPNGEARSDAVLNLTKKVADYVLTTSAAAINKADKAISFQKEGNFDEAHRYRKQASVKVDNIIISVVGFMELSQIDSITDHAKALYDRADPRYWGYMAGEYHKWATEYLSSDSA